MNGNEKREKRPFILLGLEVYKTKAREAFLR